MKFMNKVLMVLLAVGLSLVSLEAGKQPTKKANKANKKETPVKPKAKTNVQLVAAIQAKNPDFKPTFVGNRVFLDSQFLTKEDLQARLALYDAIVIPIDQVTQVDGNLEATVGSNELNQDGPRESANSTVESMVESMVESIVSEQGDVKKENLVHRIVYAGKTFIVVGVSSTLTTGLLTYLIEQSGLSDISPEAQALGNIVIISAASLYRLFRASGHIERPVQNLEQTAQGSFGYRAGALAYRFLSVAVLSTLAAGTIANLFNISPAAQALMNISGITSGAYLVFSSRAAKSTNPASLDSHDSVSSINEID